ncbi:hypothetical protein EYC80_004471 [Monilinia laxa]|uniref:Uncharacterized protein n=1 Tax=Monilinia laxa TaxID=61186 RepID=A0A5N6KNG8_MONLA|nr:hypothetical protein EYC80_004471 [Monilinia laxa]
MIPLFSLLSPPLWQHILLEFTCSQTPAFPYQLILHHLSSNPEMTFRNPLEKDPIFSISWPCASTMQQQLCDITPPLDIEDYDGENGCILCHLRIKFMANMPSYSTIHLQPSVSPYRGELSKSYGPEIIWNYGITISAIM